MELREALAQISAIRSQLARTEVFRGYRAAPVAFSGLLAFAAAAIQEAWVTDPARQEGAYLGLWLGAAAIAAVVSGAGMAVRNRLVGASWARRLTWLAVEQFLPCVVAGALLTAALVRSAPEQLRLLPGLWQVLFSLGIFASCRLLPRAIFGVAAFYLASGVVVLALAGEGRSLSPWAMGVPFGVGQLLAAAVLYWNLERGDVDPTEG
jgi:hypothetical protein